MTDVAQNQVTVLPAGLRAWRTERDLTQGALAKKASCSESLIALIETGKRQPGLGNAFAIARALGVPLEAFAIVHVDLADTPAPAEPEAVAS